MKNPADLTLERYFFDVYLKMADISPATRETYQRVLVGRVFPHLGTVKVSDITRKSVSQMLRTLVTDGVSPGTVGKAKRTLSAILTPLVEDEDLLANPAFGVKVPKVPQKVPQYLTPEEVKEILKYTSDIQGLLIRMLVETGARFGEAAELRPRDFNFRKNVLTISRSVSDVGDTPTGRFLVKSTKSSQYRQVPITPALAARLRQHIRQHGISQVGLLFPQSLVAPAKRVLAHSDNQTDHLPREQWTRIWRAAVDAAGLDWKPRTHDLRHAYGTWNLQAGRDIMTVKTRLGHHSIVMTQIYTHAIDVENDPSAECVSALLV